MRRLRRTLRVARRAVDRLAEAGYADPVDDALSVRPEKVIAETGLLLVAASTAGDADVTADVHELAAELEQHARSERMLLGLALEPTSAWDYAQAHVMLTRLGYPDPAFDRMLTASRSARVADGRERLPHRRLELAWLRSALASAPDTGDGWVPTDDALRHPTDLLTGGRDDAYAFTHAVMYLGDFGIRPATWPRATDEICAEAEGILARSLDQQDYDLVAETLLAWPQTGSTWSPGAAFGFQVVAAVEDRAGFLPNSALDLDRLRTLSGDEKSDYLLAASYHTIYAMGLLCASSLRPGLAPPARIPVGTPAAGAAEDLAPFLRPGASPPHWARELEGLDAAERDALAPLLLAVAIRRCVDARQFATVYDLVAVAHRLSLSNAPIVSQAAELLTRLRTLATVLAGADPDRAGGG